MGISSIGVGTIGMGVGSKEVGGISLSVTLADGMDSSTGDGDIGSVHAGSRLTEGVVVGIGVASIGIGSQEVSGIGLSVTLADGMDSITGDGDIGSVHAGSRPH